MTILRVATVLAALILGGCAETMSYRAADVPDEPVADGDRVTGRVLVYTTRTDDERQISGGDTSFTGEGLKLTTSVGVMVREIALRVFSRAASQGADARDDFVNAGRYAIVLRPQIVNFEYSFAHPKLGIEITPQVHVTLRITLLDPSGRVMLEKDYDSGVVSGTRHVISGKLAERTNKLAHETLYDLMRRAAVDVHIYQQTRAAAERPQ